MRLSRKQKALALKLFGTDRLTIRQFKRAMDDYKEASKEAFTEANDADLLALAEAASEMKQESQRYHVGRCPMNGCKSQNDGFFVDTSQNIGGCRQCKWQQNGQGAGPIGFIASLYHLSAHDARDHILGRQISVTLPKVEYKKRVQKAKVKRERLDFSQFMQWGRENLASNSGLADWARAYFANRGIYERTLNHFGVGVVTQWGRLFVAMPFYSNVDFMLCAVRLRQESAKKAKQSMRGSIFQDVSFGLDAVEGHEIGVIVEGEVNALSIWQTLEELGIRADVLSVGSESALVDSSGLIARKHLKAAKSLIIWADKESKGHQTRKVIEKVRPDLAIAVLHSLEIEGRKGKIDANDLLMSGHLTNLLEQVLPMPKPASPVPNSGTPEKTPPEHRIEALVSEGRFDEALRLVHGLKNATIRGRWFRRIALMRRTSMT